MPTYEYECESGHRFEWTHSIHKRLLRCQVAEPGLTDDDTACAVYCEAPVKRLLFPVAGKVAGSANPCRGRR